MRFAPLPAPCQPVWALGVLCFEIAAGEYPFEAYLTMDPPFAVRPLPGAPLLELGMPPIFAELLQRMAHNQPSARPSLEEALVCLMTLPD